MYELKHFCLQYHEWQYELMSIDILRSGRIYDTPGVKQMDPVGDLVVKRDRLLHRIALVNEAIRLLNDPIDIYIFRAVTDDLTFPVFEAEGIPCGRDYYYDRYRKFFYFLDKLRE